MESRNNVQLVDSITISDDEEIIFVNEETVCVCHNKNDTEFQINPPKRRLIKKTRCSNECITISDDDEDDDVTRVNKEKEKLNIKTEINRLKMGNGKMEISDDDFGIELQNYNIKVENVGTLMENMLNIKKEDDYGMEIKNADIKIENIKFSMENAAIKMENIDSTIENAGIKVENIDFSMENAEIKVESVDVSIENINKNFEKVDINVGNIKIEIVADVEDNNEIVRKAFKGRIEKINRMHMLGYSSEKDDVEEEEEEEENDFKIYNFHGPSSTIHILLYLNLGNHRMHLLKAIEKADSVHPSFTPKWIDYIKETLRKHELYEYLRLLENEGTATDNKTDWRAHYVLRLGMSKRRHAWCWWLDKELQYYKYRLIRSEMTFEEYTKMHNIKNFLVRCDQERLKLIETDLIASTETTNKELELMKRSEHHSSAINETIYYKVPVQRVPHLVANHSVYVRKGVAYVPNYLSYHVILAYIKMDIEQTYDISRKTLAYKIDDVFVRNFAKHWIAIKEDPLLVKEEEEEEKKQHEQIVDIEDLVKNGRMPLCMATLYNKLTDRKAHLMYRERFQYLIYLRDLGVPYSVTYEHWKKEFTATMSDAKFDRKYKYGIEHAYGLTGRRKGADPITCQQIIHYPSSVGQSYGCPFKEWSTQTLRNRLKSDGLNETAIQDTLSPLNDENPDFQMACGNFLKYSCNTDFVPEILYPTTFTELSTKK